MAQSTQYLYEYENGKPIRNLGFMKIDKQMDKVILQIYGKQLEEVTGIRLRKEDGSQYVATWQGEEISIPVKSQNSEDIPIQQPEIKRQETSAQPVVIEQGEIEVEEEVEEYITPSSVCYEKIQRQDLSRLPRREWRIANNSFLLHGFYNYHHLLYIEEGGKIWIGVPGIYHEKEKVMAQSFGFPEFKRLVDVQLELSQEETNTYDDFGYWCRQVEIS